MDEVHFARDQILWKKERTNKVEKIDQKVAPKIG